MAIAGAAIVLPGCSNESRQESPPDDQAQAPGASVDIRMPRVSAPPFMPAGADTPTPSELETTSSIARPTTSSVAQAPSDPTINRDVGYEGLKSSIDNLERVTLPILSDRNKLLSPAVADQAIRQSQAFMKEIQNAKSVEKELRHEIWDQSIDLNSALTEMKDAVAGPRYEQLRGTVLRSVEQIQGVLVTGAESQL